MIDRQSLRISPTIDCIFSSRAQKSVAQNFTKPFHFSQPSVTLSYEDKMSEENAGPLGCFVGQYNAASLIKKEVSLAQAILGEKSQTSDIQEATWVWQSSWNNIGQ